MLPVSEAFRELMKSNVRPKCELTITVKDALGIGRDLVWSSDKVEKISYKRAIDPIGRELPFMELRWTEVYRGKMNEDLYPQIYENVSAFLPVKLKIKQFLGFSNTWKNIFDRNLTWKEIFEKKINWHGIFKDSVVDEFEYPTLFLSSKPTIKEQKIEWVAYDLMHYMNSNSSQKLGETSILRFVPQMIMLDSCSSMLENKEMILSVQDSIFNFEKKNKEDDSTIGKEVLIDGSANSLLKDWMSIQGKYWDFSKNIIIEKNIFEDFTRTEFSFPLYLHYKTPTLTKNENISRYDFKQYSVERNDKKIYEKAPDSSYMVKAIQGYRDFYVFRFVFDGYGEFAESDFGKESPTVGYSLNRDVKIIPIEIIAIPHSINVEKEGIVFKEDNKANFFGKEGSDQALGFNPFVSKRSSNLQKYFNQNVYSAEVDVAPNVALETGDVISIETNLYNATGDRIQKDFVIVEIELNYSGVLKQKIKAHEVKYE